MFILIKDIFSLLLENQRNKFYKLQALVIIMALSELLSIASIGVFITLVGNIELIEKSDLLSDVYIMFGMFEPYEFLFIIGLLVLFILVITSVLSIVTVWQISRFAANTGSEIATRLYTHYMTQGWLFHSNTSTSHITKQISSETIRLTDSILQPLLMLNSRIVLAFFISLGILIYNPIVALSLLAVLLLSYFFLYKIVRKRLYENGSELSKLTTKRFRLMNEGFGGIKDILLFGRSQDFIERFKQTGKSFAMAKASNATLALIPRYIIELIVFSSVIIIVLVLIVANYSNLQYILPTLAIYAFAGLKLLPALQQIYASTAQIKGNVAAFENVVQDLGVSERYSQKNVYSSQDTGNVCITFKDSLELRSITFTYPGKSTPVLSNYNMIIPVNSVIGLVGPSGSGKSTVVDFILALISSDSSQGLLLVDNIPIDEANKRSWQSLIGFVPQQIYLSEGSIAENVAFGIPSKYIDLDKVNNAIKLAHLDKWVEEQPSGLHTKVGERGIKISGGQRQRIGIARALYNDAEVLVFDEATSALDGVTEKLIMDAIQDFYGKKTIILIAHRLKTVQKCNNIFYIENGQVVNQGSYEELLNTNPEFKKMANQT